MTREAAAGASRHQQHSTKVFSTPSAMSPPQLSSRNSGSSSGPLDEWSFAIDNSTGNVYFYNRRTRETRWTLPGEDVATSLISSLSTAHSIMKKVEQEEEARANESTSGPASAGSNRSMSQASGEEGKENLIKEAIDPHTGRKYYYDVLTRKSFWEDPRIQKKTLSMVSAASSSQTQSLQQPKSLSAQETASRPASKNEEELAPGGSYSATKVGDLSMIPAAGEEEEEEKRAEPKSSALFVDESSDAPLVKQLGSFSPTRSTREHPESPSRQSSMSSAVERMALERMLLSQDRLPSSSLKGDAEFNKNDLRLLKQRLSELKSKSSPSKASSAMRTEEDVRKDRGGETRKDDTVKERPSIARRQEPITSGVPSSNRSSTIAVKTPASSSGRPSTAPASSGGPCLRRSGCTCQACLTGTPVAVSARPGDHSSPQVEGELFPCGRCGRKFNEKSLAVHERVCAKVFSAKKKKEEVAAEDDEELQARGSKKPVAVSSGLPKWRKQSQELRLAMQRGRGAGSDSPSIADRFEPSMGGTADYGGAQDDGLVMCPHCERRFNEKAAERHIPKCNDIRSKPKTLRKGEGKSVYKANLSSPAMNATSSPSLTPGFGAGGQQGSAGPTGRKSLAGSNAMNTSTLSERGVTTVTCPDCRRRFSSKVFERHSQTCPAQSRHGVLSTSFSRQSGLRKSIPLSPASSRSSSSWDGGRFDDDE